MTKAEPRERIFCTDGGREFLFFNHVLPVRPVSVDFKPTGETPGHIGSALRANLRQEKHGDEAATVAPFFDVSAFGTNSFMDLLIIHFRGPFDCNLA